MLQTLSVTRDSRDALRPRLDADRYMADRGAAREQALDELTRLNQVIGLYDA